MISAFVRLRRARSWCDLGFGQSASVYLRRASFLDQNVRLFSIGDVKTCWFIITYSRLTPDSLKIRFFVQIDFFAAHGGQGGVNGGSEGTKDLLAWSPNNAVRFGVFTLLLAYFLKLPGNFGQHNLANGCPHAQTEARYPTRTLHKRPPVLFFSQKNVTIREIALFA